MNWPLIGIFFLGVGIWAVGYGFGLAAGERETRDQIDRLFDRLLTLRHDFEITKQALVEAHRAQTDPVPMTPRERLLIAEYDALLDAEEDNTNE